VFAAGNPRTEISCKKLVPPGRERIHQGQQFDEMQQQKKNPDGAPREQEQA
jgi:hypothetical protein